MLHRFILGCMALTSTCYAGNYFIEHNVTAYNSQNHTLTLDDGSTWLVTNVPNPSLQENASVWIVPVMQETFIAVFFSGTFGASTTQMTHGNPNLTITSITDGIVTLKDGSQWQLDAYYQNYTQGWQVGDQITYAGRHNEYYLINGSTSGGPTYCLVSKASSQ